MSDPAAYPLESALRCHERGDLAGAERFYQEALIEDPHDVQTVHCAGLLALQAGNFALAAVRLRWALELGVTLPGTHLLLGRALKGQGDIDGAIDSYRRAIAGDAGMVDAHVSLGLALKDQGRLDEAVDAYRAALRRDPDSFEALLNLGNTLQLQGRLEEALSEYEKAAGLRPGSAQLQYNMGKVLRAQQRDAEAVERFQRAIVLDEDYLEAYLNLGNALTSTGHYAQAIECFRHLLGRIEAGAGRPADPAERERLRLTALTALVAPLVWAARFDEAAPLMQEALAREPDSVVLSEYRLVVLPYRCERRDEVLDIYAHYQRISPIRLERPLATAPRSIAPERLRIAYLSGDLRDHSIAFFLEPLLAHHDRAAFEVLCYSTNRRDDEVTARLMTYADAWIEARDLGDEALARRIADDGVDILIDLSGRTVQNRLGVLAKRPAFLQLGYLGYPTYTGVPQIAFRVTDTVIDPPGEPGLDSERPLRMSRSMFCYRPPADAPERPYRRAGERGYVCFGSFNQVQKLSPALLAAWARILAEAPGSRLLLKATAFADEETRRRVVQAIVREGIEAERLSIRAGIADRAEHLALYGEIDIALDTFPYNGATTSCEALWMGVPVVTLAGETHASRMGASLLGALGLSDLIARSWDEYVATAVRLARSGDELEALHATLRKRFNASVLRDEPGFARAFEQALLEAWRARAR